MKNYKSLPDSELLQQIRIDAENERRSGLAVLHQLREIARRRLDARLGYKSLHAYCMEELKYSAGSAWRRIRAMEALKEFPELESRIESGDFVAHSHPGASYAEVIKYLANLGLKKLDPTVDKKPARILPPGEETKAIPTAVRREVWRRDHGRCGYVSGETGKICGATAFLQLDHVVPRAKGGGNNPENLALRCRRHNLLAAVDEFGERKMAPFLKNKGQQHVRCGGR